MKKRHFFAIISGCYIGLLGVHLGLSFSNIWTWVYAAIGSIILGVIYGELES
jgi:amino acid transporter